MVSGAVKSWWLGSNRLTYIIFGFFLNLARHREPHKSYFRFRFQGQLNNMYLFWSNMKIRLSFCESETLIDPVVDIFRMSLVREGVNYRVISSQEIFEVHGHFQNPETGLDQVLNFLQVFSFS